MIVVDKSNGFVGESIREVFAGVRLVEIWKRERTVITTSARTPSFPAHNVDGVNSVSMSILAAQQARSTGRTIRSVRIRIGEQHAVHCQPVDIRSFVIVGSLAAQVRPAEAINVEEHNVWSSAVCEWRQNK